MTLDIIYRITRLQSIDSSNNIWVIRRTQLRSVNIIQKIMFINYTPKRRLDLGYKTKSKNTEKTIAKYKNVI